ncbi:MAG: hypothetical protein WDA20_12165 [Desulfuromonadales bacterium]|jgi:hypothetical protein
MKISQRIFFGAALVMLALWPATEALAISVSGRASTELEWYDNAEENTVAPLYQYLLLNVRDLGVDGLNFRAYGRVADDLNDEETIGSELYYAYLEKNDLFTDLDLRLGRQFIATTAGASLLDGIRLKYRNLGPLAIEVFGGGDVSFYEGYDEEDLVGGVEVSGRFKNLNLGVSYLQKREDSDLAKELFGLDAALDFADIIQLYSEVQYDWISDRVSYFLGGFNYYRSPTWSLRAEFLHSLPVFSSTSIYSVFAVEEYEEVMAELSYRLGTGLRAFGRYSREFYEDYSDNVIEAGVEKIRTERVSGYLIGTYRDSDDGQDLQGVKARVAYLFGQKLETGLGVHVDVFERELDEDSDETTSSRVWADTTLYLSKTLNVQGKVERVESDIWDEYYRGRVRLNLYF